jgi:prepilin-type N-terminal cleavage/methylation domain-containing protein
MLNKIKKDNKGFTIIEVLIVLAIAGLILLVVFLAVPALQRNSRNTQLNSAVSSVLAGVTEYESNNNGALPTSVSTTSGTVTISGAGTPTTVKIGGGLNANSTAATGVDIVINLKAKCDPASSTAATTTTNATRNYAATYSLETSGSPAPRCTNG